MRLQFTPAAQRVLEAASHWTSGDDPNGLAPPELLLGLLAEGECRGAGMLAGKGIDAAAVRQRWPALQFVEQVPHERAAAFSDPVEAALAAAIARLVDYPPPLVLATEHLLLGLVASTHESAAWLAERGFVPEELEAEIHRLAGHRPGLLPLPLAEGRGEGDAAAVVDSCVPAEAEVVPAPPHPNPLPKGEGTNALRLPLGERLKVLRIVDAAANRAREGLRVLEDFARFALDDRRLTGEFKQLRHALAAELSQISAAELVAARDTWADVGTQLTSAAERRRPDLPSVLVANFKRVQEALRSLEEYGKTLDAEFGAAMKQLRYRMYVLEREVAVAHPDAPRNSKPGALARRIEQARLYVLVDGRSTLDEFDAIVRELIAAGVDAIQLRDKRLADRDLLDRAKRLRELTAGARTLFIMNDRADLAALAGADGVHVGQDELSVADVRAIVGSAALVGVSTHSLDQARQALLEGADYIGVGPTFASTTKPFETARLTGLDLLRAVAAEIRLPAFAIGGIDRDNLGEVIAAGFSRIAVSGAVVSAADPALAAREMLRILLEVRG
ncbi:MAG TPA: thiamine phosphate synthase [Pirellulales bacterium]|nr:thiamine phosphate synthase [Pirellulales bacterium]